MKKIKFISISIIILAAIVLMSGCKKKSDEFDSDLVEKSEKPNWNSPDPSAYEFSMTYMGQIAFNGTISKNTGTIVAAFCENECRGKVNLIAEPELDSYMFYLTIYSNNPLGEKIVIKTYDSSKKWLYKKPYSFVFESNGSLGGVNNVLDCISK